MKRILLASLLVVVGVGSAQAQIISSATPIPGAYVLMNYAGSGLDWVYAGPIAPNEWGPGDIQPAAYRAAEGWRTATAAEWAAHPLWNDFIAPGNPGGIVSSGTFYNHAHYIYASEYWSYFSHVDAQDFDQGRVTDGVNGVLSGVPETIYVRMTSAVPEPSTVTMLLAGLAGLAFLRRRQA
ncbi:MULTISPECIES: PEP-CTERM sorting domain-containing protein [unclassified Janthinobacterium]|uniref:PEP-CTERM sorting domain-containing protein n=1 Tax=unclassified Janthinobacterium TaxID=2610881 RepID=UPI000563FF68|nr:MULTISPECIES: PEP-CTERM sorting domain-containing protein [unclassified Janthinobacterium]MEC5162321.1 hypothetical protein [Janthinobacterium sp. CG_S6]